MPNLPSFDLAHTASGLLARIGIGRKKEAVRDHLEIMSRIGFAANGVIYVSIGLLILATTLGLRTQPVDERGLLHVVANQPMGRLWLIVLGMGLWAFVGWRLLQALFDIDREGSDLRGWAVRIAQGFSGLFYGVIAFAIFSLLHDANAIDGAAQVAQNRHQAALVLGLPFGSILLTLTGLCIAGVGISNVVTGFVSDFGATLSCSKEVRRWVLPLARIGYVARGLGYLPLAVFVVLAGWRAEATRVETFASALDAVGNQPGGVWLLTATGVGLVAYGAYAFVEARYRRCRAPADLKPR